MFLLSLIAAASAIFFSWFMVPLSSVCGGEHSRKYDRQCNVVGVVVKIRADMIVNRRWLFVCWQTRFYPKTFGSLNASPISDQYSFQPNNATRLGIHTTITALSASTRRILASQSSLISPHTRHLLLPFSPSLFHTRVLPIQCIGHSTQDGTRYSLPSPSHCNECQQATTECSRRLPQNSNRCSAGCYNQGERICRPHQNTVCLAFGLHDTTHSQFSGRLQCHAHNPWNCQKSQHNPNRLNPR